MDNFSDAAKLDALGRVLDAIRENGDTNATRILSYIVTESIEGRSGRIKAYSIAQDVLHRGSDFDPTTDSIVRVEMKRLRESLEHYYATTGRDDPVRIEIPRGRYVPVFVGQNSAASVVAADTPGEGRSRSYLGWVIGLGIVVLLVTLAVYMVRGGSAPMDRSRGEPYLAVQLGDPEVRQAFVVARNTLSRFKNLPTIDADSAGSTVPDYLMRLTADGAVIEAVLTHVESGQVLAGRSFHPNDIGETTAPDRPTLFRVWLGMISSRGGIVESDYVERDDYSGDFACSVLVEDYFATQNDENHLIARNCLLDRLEEGIESARLYFDLAMMARDEYMDRRNPLPTHPIVRSAEYAHKAVALDPFDAYGHYALMTVMSAAGGWDEARLAGEQALALLPFDWRIVGGYGARLNTMGEHRRALALFAQSRQMSPRPASWRDYGIFLAHFGLGEMDEAADAAYSLIGNRNSLYLAALAIASAHRGTLTEARQATQRLRELVPNYEDIYARRGYAPELIARLVAALEAIDA
ncbi:tetratricopeptide repeat protein [Pseudooceanicola sp.]|uniref:tetratricopeptide repeat protein n=1 Tax=Pseudooceanicola sp. TaxID=1914328 RepID=UPI0035C75F60